MNLVALAGPVATEPEIKGNETVATFRMATRGYDFKEKTPKSDFHNIVSFGKTVSAVIKPFVRKGSYITVVGRLEEEVWTGKDNIQRRRSVVVAERIELGGSNRSGSNADSGPSVRPEAPAEDSMDDPPF